MTPLSELQAQFHDFLLGRGGDIEALTVGSERLPARQRLAVYADAYKLRLIEILADDFPGLKAMLGEAPFEALADAYIDVCPSTHPSVRWFGRHLAAFLREHPAYRGRPALAEMAAFEWAQGEVTDAADSARVDEDALAARPAVSWPQMRIGFQNALRRLDLHWNTPVIWQAIDAGDTPPPPARSEPPVAWLLWRRDLAVHWRSLDDTERYALDAAREGLDFGELCRGLLDRTGDEQVPMRAAGYLKRWVTDELVAALL